jgi:hypothetical protein
VPKLIDVWNKYSSKNSPKTKIPGEKMGYLTYFLDSEKNVMGLWAMN